jgi:urea transport system ATP-binding protein
VKLLRKEGKIGILLVEQYLDFCLDVGDQFYIMDRGAVVAEGPMASGTVVSPCRRSLRCIDRP